MCDITAVLLEGMNADDADSAKLEEARSKLILAHVPKGSSKPHELRLRFAAWTAGDFDGLLQRIKNQHIHATASRSKQAPAGSRVSNSRRLARGGARRKAVQALTSDVAQLTSEQQRHWANELLPGAGPNGSTPVPPLPPIEIAADALDGSGSSPMEGVRFGPLSAAGPSGARPEHLRDMLTCGRRRATNRLLQALRVAEALADAGRLPDAWIGILRTRLVFLRKRRGTKAVELSPAQSASASYGGA